MTLPATMQAIRFHRKGPPEVLQYDTLPCPAPKAGEVLARLEAIGVNYADVMRRKGDHYPVPSPLPFLPGGEGVGVVAAVGEGVDPALLGQRTFVFPGGGCYAEYVICPVDRLYPLPEGVKDTEAIALFVQGLSAALILRSSARMQRGETVLVQGAAGGVGTLAVQLAKAWGAGLVIGLASSPAKRRMVLELGADAAIDYGAEDWVDQVRALTGGRGVDIVLEMTGGKVAEQSLSLLAPFGRSVVFGAASETPLILDTQKLPPRNMSVTGFWLRQYLDQRALLVGLLEEFGQLAQAGKLKIMVDRCLPLSKACEAHALLESRATSGKLILVPDPLFEPGAAA